MPRPKGSTNKTTRTRMASGYQLSQEDIRNLIQKKAFEIYCQRSQMRRPGDAMSDWLMAEKLVMQELTNR